MIHLCRCRFKRHPSKCFISSVCYRRRNPYEPTVWSQSRQSTSLVDTQDVPTDPHLVDHPFGIVDDRFTQQVQTTVNRFFSFYNLPMSTVSGKNENDMFLFSIESLPPTERESFCVVRHLYRSIQAMKSKHKCLRCWMPYHKFCTCSQICDVEHLLSSYNTKLVQRIFLLTHHKEFGLAVDTSKIIMAAFPESTRLVIAGIPGTFQESMNEFMQVVQNENTLVLFPSPNSKTLADIFANQHPLQQREQEVARSSEISPVYDVILIDGTWKQAQQMYSRYIPDSSPAPRIRLSETDLQPMLVSSSAATAGTTTMGRQLRPHPQPLREIATVHALQLFLQDMLACTIWKQHPTKQEIDARSEQIDRVLVEYQTVTRKSVEAFLGAERMRMKHQSRQT